MPLVTDDIDFLRNLISQRSGNVISAQQGYLLESRLAPVARQQGLPNVEALVEVLRKGASKLHDHVAEAMTINETSFYRDQQPFDALRDVVLPAIIAKRSTTRCLNLWCAASSSGQEPYSIAMLIREHFPQLGDWNVRIIATDLSDEMVRRTSAGTYSQFEVNRGLPTRLLVKNFEKQGMNWQVRPDLRAMVDCRKLNLAAPWPAFPKFDVVFIRNVLIYFDKPAKESILTRVARTMAADGKLFLGGGETLINLDVPLVREVAGPTICFAPILPV